MTIIFYARVGGKRYVGFGLPGWGVAVVAGALITLASATSFYLGDFAAALAHRQDEQRLVQNKLARMEERVRRIRATNSANLSAATAKLGELHARMSALDTKGINLLAVAGAHDEPGPEKRVETPVWAFESSNGRLVAGLPQVGSNDAN